MLNSGQKFGDYQILGLLGQGGMGTVYEAIDERLDRRVALKVITEEYARLPEYQARLVEEAKIAARIDSSYVVKIWECSVLEGLPYISYEYVSGKDLSQCISDLALVEKIRIARQIADGLRATHALGMLHRDLKPQNIRISESGNVKILDFGLARQIGTDSIDKYGNIEGTLFYMSPEQLSGMKETFVSDIFSLGVVFYELLTGHRPFDGDYPASIVYSVLHEDPIPPRERIPELPEWVDPLLMKLLAKNPDDRIESVSAVIDFIDMAEKSGGDSRGIGAYRVRTKSVTVVDLRNLSGDSSWDYFCLGFTEDLIREISRRTEIIISAEPGSSAERDIKAVFKRCRSDYVVTGSLLQWEDSIQLNLSAYGDGGTRLVFGEKYSGEKKRLLDLLAKAAEDTSVSLARESGSSFVDVEHYLATNISAYEYYLRGRSYYHTSKPDDLEAAVHIFSRALELDPNFALAHTGLADVYAFQYNAYYDRSPQKIELAFGEVEKALKLDSNLPEAHRALGRCYMFIGAFGRAEESLIRAVTISPKFAIGHRALAWMKETIGDDEGALMWAKKALELAPTDLETLLLLGLIYLNSRKYTLAMATLQRAIELGPDYGRAYYNLGTVYMKLGVPDLAIENFLLAIKYKGDPNGHVDAGYAYLAIGDYNSAEEHFLQSIKHGLMTFIALYFLGLICKLRDNATRADEYFRAANESAEDCERRDPGNCHALCYCALALAASGEVERAEAIIEKIAIRPDSQGDVHYNIARYHALAGNARDVEKFVEMAVHEHGGPTKKEIALDPHFTNRFSK